MKPLDQLQRYDARDYGRGMSTNACGEYVKLSDVEELLKEIDPDTGPPLTTAQYKHICEAAPLAPKFQTQDLTPIPPEKNEWSRE